MQEGSDIKSRLLDRFRSKNIIKEDDLLWKNDQERESEEEKLRRRDVVARVMAKFKANY